MTKLFIIGLMLAQPVQQVDETVSLEYCYQLLEEQYPAADKIALQERIAELKQDIARSGYYPDINLTGMASYQSDVTEIGFAPPGGSTPTFSKDHYRVALDINQSLFDGGRTSSLMSLEYSREAVESISVEVELQRIKEQVTGVYFGTLILQEQLKSISLKSENLRQQLSAARARVENGVALLGQASVLEAERIKAEQDSLRLRAEYKGMKELLGILIGEEIGSEVGLEIPEIEPAEQEEIPVTRPEYRLFDATSAMLGDQIELTGASKVPSISAFAITAYGRPGLNAFEDDLQPSYVVGLRMQWNLWNAINAGREQQSIRIEQQKIEADRLAFTRQLRGTLSRLWEQISALEEIIRRDEEIIRLSRQASDESSSLLSRGVITSAEYILELNRLYQAELSRGIHRIELARAKTDYKIKMEGTL